MKKKVDNVPQPTWSQLLTYLKQHGLKITKATHVGILPEIFVKRKLECNNSCENDTVLEPGSSDSYGGITFFEEHGTRFKQMKENENEIYSGFNFSIATLYFCILNDTMSSGEFCLTNCRKETELSSDSETP